LLTRQHTDNFRTYFQKILVIDAASGNAGLISRRIILTLGMASDVVLHYHRCHLIGLKWAIII